MRKFILKFNILLLLTITLLWIFIPSLYPKTSTACDIVLCRFQVGMYNTFVNSVKAETQSTTKIAITFDDGFKSVYTNAYPILEKYNYSASIAVVGDRIGEYGYLSYKELSVLYRDGYEMLNHSYSHEQRKKLSLLELRREYKLNNLLLKVCGFMGSNDIIIAPGGQYYYNHIAIAKDGEYSAVRSLKKLYVKDIDKAGNISIINVYGSRPMNDIIFEINKAISKEQNIILVFHKIEDEHPKSEMYVSMDKFTKIMEYIDKNYMDVTSYSDLIQSEVESIN